jgi:hypothetical protein
MILKNIFSHLLEHIFEKKITLLSSLTLSVRLYHIFLPSFNLRSSKNIGF